MSKHTPGPWRKLRRKGTAAGMVVIEARHADGSVEWVAECCERDGDAIAAQPELLAAAKQAEIALSKLVGDIEKSRGKWNSPALTDLRAAIAAAEGE